VTELSITKPSTAPVMKAYLDGEELPSEGIGTMRAYLRQWISSPVWLESTELTELRESVEKIATTEDIDVWLLQAAAEGIDPL
jgi:hypothetical protein